MATSIECILHKGLTEYGTWGLAPTCSLGAFEDALVETVEVNFPCASSDHFAAVRGESNAPECGAWALTRGDCARVLAVVCLFPGKDGDAVVIVKSCGNHELSVARESHTFDAFRERSSVAGETLHRRCVPDANPGMAPDLPSRAELTCRVRSKAQYIVVVLKHELLGVALLV